MSKVPKIGEIWRFEFLDHSMATGQSAAPAICESFGKIVGMDKNCFYQAFWICENLPQDANTEILVILKSTITKKERLYAR